MMAWKAPTMWQGAECVIIGGGSSMPYQFGIPEEIVRAVIDKKEAPSAYTPYMEKVLQGKFVIAVNNAFLLGRFIDVLLFGDNAWFLSWKKEVLGWYGLVVTCANDFAGVMEDEAPGIKYLPRDTHKPQGISDNPSALSWNGNSGAAAINLAVHFGVRKIVLLGFDMSLDENGKSHWHNAHHPMEMPVTKIKKPPPFHRHLRGFPKIAEDAKHRGVEIINCSPNSMLDVFPKRSLKEALGFG